MINALISSNNEFIITSSDDLTIKMWELKSGKLIYSINNLENKGTISLKITSDDKFIISGNRDGSVNVYDFQTGNLVHRFLGHTGLVESLCLSKDNKILISGGRDQVSNVWDLGSRELIQTFKGEKQRTNNPMTDRKFTNPISSIAISNDGELVITGDWGGNLNIWDIISGKLIKTITPNKGAINNIVSNEENQLIVGCNNGTIDIWSIDSGSLIKSYMPTGTEHSLVNVLEFSKDLQYVVTGDRHRKSISLWNLKSEQTNFILGNHPEGIEAVDISNDNQFIVTGSKDNSVRLWDFKSSSLIWEIDTKLSKPLSTLVNLEQNELSIIIETDIYKAKRIHWKLDGGIIKNPVILEKPFKTLSHVISKDGRYWIAGDFHGKISVWDLYTGKQIQTFNNHSKTIKAIAIDEKNQILASSAFKEAVYVWRLDNGKVLYTLEINNAYSSELVFSEDNKHLISANNDGSITVWEVATGRIVNSITENRNLGKILSIKGNQIIVSGGENSSVIKVWNFLSSEFHQGFKNGKEYTKIFEVNKNSDKLLSVSRDNKVAIWDFTSRELIKVIDPKIDNITSVEIKNNILIILCQDHIIRLWDIIKDKSVAEIFLFKDNGYIILSEDGEFDANQQGLKYIHYVEKNRPQDLIKTNNNLFKPNLISKFLKD